MDYAGWVTAICSLLEYQVTDATSATPTDVEAFNAILPSAINYTENRLQRDLDFIATTVTSRGWMMANSRLVTLPSIDVPSPDQIPDLIGTPIPPNSLITVTSGSMLANVFWVANGLTMGENVSILDPLLIANLTLGGVYNVVGVVDADNFTINTGFNANANATVGVVGNGIYVVATQIRLLGQPPLEVVTRDYLDYAWPSDDGISADVTPAQWCPNDQTSFYVGPAPYTNLQFEAVGTMRFPQLSAANYSNFLTKFVPDLYVACSMIYFAMYQKDFSSADDDPKMGQSYENQYQLLLRSAQVEETRKTFANMSPSPSNPSTLKATG